MENSLQRRHSQRQHEPKHHERKSKHEEVEKKILKCRGLREGEVKVHSVAAAVYFPAKSPAWLIPALMPGCSSSLSLSISPQREENAVIKSRPVASRALQIRIEQRR